MEKGTNKYATPDERSPELRAIHEKEAKNGEGLVHWTQEGGSGDQAQMGALIKNLERIGPKLEIITSQTDLITSREDVKKVLDVAKKFLDLSSKLKQ